MVVLVSFNIVLPLMICCCFLWCCIVCLICVLLLGLFVCLVLFGSSYLLVAVSVCPLLCSDMLKACFELGLIACSCVCDMRLISWFGVLVFCVFMICHLELRFNIVIVCRV